MCVTFVFVFVEPHVPPRLSWFVIVLEGEGIQLRYWFVLRNECETMFEFSIYSQKNYWEAQGKRWMTLHIWKFSFVVYWYCTSTVAAVVARKVTAFALFREHYLRLLARATSHFQLKNKIFLQYPEFLGSAMQCNMTVWMSCHSLCHVTVIITMMWTLQCIKNPS